MVFIVIFLWIYHVWSNMCPRRILRVEILLCFNIPFVWNIVYFFSYFRFLWPGPLQPTRHGHHFMASTYFDWPIKCFWWPSRAQGVSGQCSLKVHLFAVRFIRWYSNLDGYAILVCCLCCILTVQFLQHNVLSQQFDFKEPG